MIDMKQNLNPIAEKDLALVRRTHGIDPAQIQPQAGQLYHLSGPGRSGKSMRCVAEHWVAHALAQGRTVHWVDGACRIDPARFIPLLEAMGARLNRAWHGSTSVEDSRFINSTDNWNGFLMNWPSHAHPWWWWTVCWPCTATMQSHRWNHAPFCDGTRTSCATSHTNTTRPL